jgi:hypothetical protein
MTHPGKLGYGTPRSTRSATSLDGRPHSHLRRGELWRTREAYSLDVPDFGGINVLNFEDIDLLRASPHLAYPIERSAQCMTLRAWPMPSDGRLCYIPVWLRVLPP